MFASTASQQHMAHTFTCEHVVEKLVQACNESRRVIWTKRAGKKDKQEFELKLSAEPLLCLCLLDLRRRCNDDEESVNDLAIRFAVERDLGDSYQQMLNQMRERRAKTRVYDAQSLLIHDRRFKADSGGKQSHMLLTRVRAKLKDVAAGKRELFVTNNCLTRQAGRLYGTYHDIIMPAPYKAIFIFPTLEKRKLLLGEEHPDTLSAMANLAVSYRKLGQLKEAAELEAVVLEKRKLLLGEEHPDTLSAMANLAVSCGELGQLKEAAAS
ncbi:hypothetical protein B0H13DRAFT_1881498 [Mycena leptocephala]|nr:hypothetical protein B0H13DRAFT_1881498 [Mycena leptocephala]